MSTIATARFRSALAVAAAGCLALTACAGSPESEGRTSEPATPSTTASSSAPATSSAPPRPQAATSTSPAKNLPKPKMPAEAKEFTKEGYEAFVNYWFEAQNYGMATGDTAPMDKVSMEKCGICVERGRTMKGAYADGGWIVGGDIKVTEFYTPLQKDIQDLYQAAVQLRESKSQPFSPAGQPIPDGLTKATTHDLNFHATYSKSGGWKMAALVGDE